MSEMSYDEANTPATRQISYEDAAKPAELGYPQVADTIEANPTGYFGRIAQAFKSGAEAGYGEEQFGFTDANKKWLHEHTSGVVKDITNHFIVPGVAYLDNLWRTPNSIYHAVGDALIAAGLPRDFVALAGQEHAYGSPHVTGNFKSVSKSEFMKTAEGLPAPERPPAEGPNYYPKPKEELSPIEKVFQAKELEVIGPEKPVPTFEDSPYAFAEQSVPRDLGAAANPDAEPIRGHNPGEYDKRGKEWVDKIDEPQDVRDVVEKIASENDYFPEARGGQVSEAVVETVAEAAGVVASDIDREQFSRTFDSDGKVRAVIQVLRQTAKDYAEAAKKAVDNPTPENLAAVAEAELRHSHAVEYTMGLRAESGRTLAAWKDLLRETEENRASVEVRKKEATGEAPKGTADVLGAVKEVRENLKDPKKEKAGLEKLVEAAQNLVDNVDKPAAEKPKAPRDPAVQSLIDTAREALKNFGAEKDAALEKFHEELTRLANGEGKLGDVVAAARELIEKPEDKKAAPKVVSAKAQLKAAAKRIVSAAENEQTKAKARDTSVQNLMEAARQAVGRLRKSNVMQEIAEFRDALSSKDPEAAAAAAQRLIDAEGKEKAAAARAQAPVEYDQIMGAARRVANAVKERETAAKPEMMPDIKQIVDEAKEAVGKLRGENKSEMQRLIDLAEKNAAEMTKQKAVKEPTEALPPELQALVDKTKRIVNQFGGAATGEKAAYLLARTGRTLSEQEQLARSVIGLSPTQVARVLEKLRNSPEATRPGWFYWLWQQGLISGLITHTKYLAVNTVTLFAERVISPAIAGALGKLRGENVSLAGPFYANVAMVTALPDALAIAAQAFKTGMRIPLESEIRLFRRGEESPQLKGAASAYTQGISPDWGIWGKIFNETQLDKAAQVLGIPGKSANMIHTFYKVLSERAAASNIAYQKAFAEGVKGDKFWDRYNHHLTNPTDEALRQAVNDAYSGAFMSALGPKLTQYSHALSKNPVTKWLFPFQHIPWNIMRMTAEYSPFAVLGPEMRDAILGRKGAPAQNLAIAKMTVGSSVLGYFMWKSMSGEATGHYPTDQQERNRWRMLGIQPNSIKIGGEWVSLERLGPIGNVAILGTAIGEIIHHYDGKDDDAMTKAIWSASMAAANVVGNEVGFQSLRNVMDALENQQKGSRFAAWQAGSFMPFSSFISQNASILDPYQREAKSIIDGLKYRLPVVREGLLPKRDPIYGEPVPNPGYHSVVRSGAINTDPIRAELDRLQIYPTAPEDRIGGVKLTPELYDRYQAVAGAFTKSGLEAIMNGQGWREMPRIAQETMVRNVISSSRKAAAATMQAANPILIEQGVQQRIDHITGAAPTARPKKPPAVEIQP